MSRIFFFFIFLCTICNGQMKNHTDIDQALVDNYNNTHTTGKYEEGIARNKELLKKAQELNNRKAQIYAYLYTANFLITINKYQESLKYLESAEKKTSDKDYKYKCEIYIEYGKAYDYLGLSDTSIDYYNKAIWYGKKIENPEIKKVLLNYVYTNKASVFESLKKNDSTYIYYQKAYRLISDPISSSNLANYFIKNNSQKLDSARYYLKVANDSLKERANHTYDKIIVYETFGDYYFEKNNFPKALEYYFKSLKTAKKIGSYEEIKLILESISNTYKKLNNEKKSIEYLEKYTRLNDSLNSADKKALNLSVEKLVRDKEDEKEELKNKNYQTLIIISLLTATFLSFGYFLYKRKKKEKEKIIRIQQETITQKETEKKNLEYKLNDSFDEVIQLAKTNSPFFLSRFKEVYPEFCEKLIAMNPDILNSEFTFCAYLKLNFSTKEIANYTFVTEKAVQARKSRIRKKFNISSDEDLYIWVNKF